MSRNDSILILKFHTNNVKRCIFIVLWTQSIENFTDFKWIKYYMSNNNLALWQYSRSLRIALVAAQKMYYLHKQPEHGIKYIDTELKIEDIDAHIVESPLVDSPENTKLIQFKTKFEELPYPDIIVPLEIKRLEEFFI